MRTILILSLLGIFSINCSKDGYMERYDYCCNLKPNDTLDLKYLDYSEIEVFKKEVYNSYKILYRVYFKRPSFQFEFRIRVDLKNIIDKVYFQEQVNL